MAAGRAAYDDGVGGRRYAVVTTACGHLHHCGTTRLDDDLSSAAAAVVGHQAATTAGSSSDTTAAVTFLVHHCGRVRVARYHAWTVATGHSVLLAAAVRPLRAPPRDGTRVIVTVVYVITALMHVYARRTIVSLQAGDAPPHQYTIITINFSITPRTRTIHTLDRRLFRLPLFVR